jgi:hypothetical protein
MTTYIGITDPETDPDAPLTATLAKKWKDNLLAVQEGDPSAPKIQPNAMRRQSFGGGAAAQTLDFTGLGAFGGVEFHGGTRNSGTVGNLTFQYSTNGGGSWSSAQTIASVTATSGWLTFNGTFDFESGALRISGAAGSSTGGLTPINVGVFMAGASLSIDAVRIQGANASITSTAILIANGATN